MRETTPAPRNRAERLRLATLDNGLRHARTELEWLDDVARELDDADPGGAEPAGTEPAGTRRTADDMEDARR